jgi:hypothetical protein
VSGTALAAGAWTVNRYPKMLTILRCNLIVAREKPVASAIPLTHLLTLRQGARRIRPSCQHRPKLQGAVLET